MKKYLSTGVLLGTIILAGCSENEETVKERELEQVLSDDQTAEADSISEAENSLVEPTIPLTLTQDQKEDYHKQYVEIVEKVNQKKLGLVLGVPPIERFQLEDWQEPEAYEKMIQTHVEGFLKTEREKLASVSTDLKPAVTNPNGETIKNTFLYFPDILREMQVTAKFDTQLNESQSRQLFSQVNEVSTKILSSYGKWQQTYQKATLLNGGQTCLIYIEGIYDFNNTTTEKAFTIEFQCDEFGNIY